MIMGLGLPGLYQNWLRKVIDPTAITRIIGSNHKTELQNPNIGWDTKVTVLTENPNYFEETENFVVNSYVAPENFAWYLINFYGKTDEIFIDLENFTEEFIAKSKGTQAFGGMYERLAQIYHFNEETTVNDVEDAFIEVTFMGIKNNNPYKNLIATTSDRDNVANIEYGDFASKRKLQTALKKIPGIDLSNLTEQHGTLNKLNDRYIHAKRYMLAKLSKVDDITKFNPIEQAIIGGAICAITSDQALDWYNRENRANMFAEFKSGVIDYLS